ncbi:MAG: hypothetical protein Q9169_007702 [Polycauliona sp. 2 TL-2023]
MVHLGPNSWAGQVHTKTPTASNRDKYENKPMPPTPETSPSAGEKPPTARKSRPYIQPATPLIAPNHMHSTSKNRAVTDPVVPQPLFTNKTTAVNQLRRKYSQTRSKSKSTRDDQSMVERPTSPPLIVSQKASQILGVLPTQDRNREAGPASAPPTTITPDPFRTSSESTGLRNTSPSRQAQSTPVLTRRYLQENHLPVSASTRTSQESKESTGASSNEQRQLRSTEEMVVSDGSLNPPRLGTFGRLREVGYVGQSAMHRVASFTGVIEGPDLPGEIEHETEPAPNGSHRDGNLLRPQYSGEILYPVTYSPNHYAGVWENDPNVVSTRFLTQGSGLAITLCQGHTLPPFSPFYRQQDRPLPAEVDQHSFSQTSGDVPIVLQKYPGESSHGSGYTHSLRSQNSWAPGGNGNSFAPNSGPSSAAETTPRFTSHVRNNSVPPPPSSYPGFQPPGLLPAGLAQMELNLHHHIESCFGSLMRLMTDNTDRTIDKLVRRAEESQESMEKGLKALKSEMKDLRKEVNGMRRELSSAFQADEQTKEGMGLMGRKLKSLDERMGEIGTCLERFAVSASDNEREEHSTWPQDSASPRRRSKSTQASASSRQEYRQAYASGTTSGSASTQQSVVSSHGQRSIAASSRAATRRSGERSGRKEGSTDGPGPDIRDHPAYRGVVEGPGPSHAVSPTPDYGEIWYQQAYGQRP